MTLSIQKTKRNPNMNNDQTSVLSGWVATGVPTGISRPGQRDETERQNLPLAAARAEQLIDALRDELSINVPVSFMKIESGTLFHVLLLISKFDFLSPKIQAARILAEKYAKTDGTYDLRFSFAIESEVLLNNSIKFNDYKLKHVRQIQEDAYEE